MSGNIGNNSFSKSTLNSFFKLDKNENNDISIKDLKEFKSHNSEPDKIFFSNNKLVLIKEIFGMKINSGHAFVVINRDVGADESKMSTWGKNAIIIDSWSGIAFKAKDYPSDIKNKKHEQFPSGELELIQIYK
ncbi:MAG: hypothetical protein AABZ74_15610 [Cyanobacteriota bacterium]